METLQPYLDEPLDIPVQELQFDEPDEGLRMVSGTLTRIISMNHSPAFAVIEGERVSHVPLQTVLGHGDLEAALEEVMRERFAVYDQLCAPSNVELSEVREPTIVGAGEVFVLDNQTGTMQQNLRRARFVAGGMTLEWAGSTSPGGALYGLDARKKSNNDFLGGAVTDEGILVVAGDGVGSSSRPDVERLIHYFKEKQGDLIKACRQAAREMTKGVCVTAQLIRGFDEQIITIRIGDVLGRSRNNIGHLIGSAEDPNNTTVYDFETGEFTHDIPAVPQSKLEYFITEHERLKAYYDTRYEEYLDDRMSPENAKSEALNDLRRLVKTEIRVDLRVAGSDEESILFNVAYSELLNRIIEGEEDTIQRNPSLLQDLGRRLIHTLGDWKFNCGKSKFDIRPGPIAEPGMRLEGASDGFYESLLPVVRPGRLPDDEWGVMTREDIVAGRGPIHTMHRLAHLVDRRIHMSCSPDYFLRLWAFLRGFKVDGDNATAYEGRLIRTP